jgi:predicted dehydrogenase
MSDLNVLVVGLGLRGGLAGSVHRPGRGGRVVGLCDLEPGPLQRWADRIGATGSAPPWTSPDAMEAVTRDDVDAVLVLTPEFSHAEISIAAMQAGKAVFCEKPMAITVEDCDAMLRTARATNSRLYIGHNMRHFAMVRTMKRLIDDGAVGEVRSVWCRHFVGHGGDYYFKDWHAQRRHVNSLLLQKGAHDIDVIHWLAGASSRRVHAFGSLSVYDRVTDRHDGTKHADWFDASVYPPARQRGLHPEIDVEDLAVMQMQLDNGGIATYQECHYSPDYWRNYTVIGTEGRIENFGDISGVVKLWNRRGNYMADGHREFPFSPAEGGHGGSDELLITEFLRFARDGGSTDTSPVAARNAVAAGCAATESMRNGGVPVGITPVDSDLVAYFANGQVAG